MKNLIVSLLLFFSLQSVSAFALTITFNNTAPPGGSTSYGNQGVYTESGYTITGRSQTFVFAADPGFDVSENPPGGTDWLAFQGPGTGFTLTTASPFSLDSFQAAVIFGFPAATLTLVGQLDGGGTIIEMFDLPASVTTATWNTFNLPGGWSNVTSVSFTSSGDRLGLENVVVGAAVIPATHTVGGTVSGLTGSVTLQNNGGDDIIKTTNDGFTFTAQAEGADYAVTVSSQPTGQTCTVTNGSGMNLLADVTNVSVVCVDDVVATYSVGGMVSGLTGSVTVQNNGGDDLVVNADGGFTFATELTDTNAYLVTVSVQPAGQTCGVTNGSGNIATADITNVAVDCMDDVLPPVEPPADATPIPAMSLWSLILLTGFIGLMVLINRRRLFQTVR